MSVQLLKIGLIGAGRIGRLHAEHLTVRVPSAELIMVADVFEENARQCAKRLAHLEAAHFGHHNVEDNEIGLVLVEGLKRRQAVFRLDDPEPLRLQYLPLQEPLGLVVIGDQDQRDGPLK